MFVASFVASSFYIVGSLSLAKIGFVLLFVGFLAQSLNGISLPKPTHPEIICYLFFVFSGLSLLWATDFVEGLKHYVSLVYCVIIFILCRIMVANNERRANYVIFSLLFACLLSCAFGYIQFFTGHLFVPGTPDRSMTTGDTFRSNGLFDDPNYFGYLLTMAWPLVLLFFKNNLICKNLLLAIIFVAVIMTFSRATLLIVAFQIVLLNAISTKNKLKAFFRIGASILLGVITIGLLNPFDITDRVLSLLPIFLDTDVGLENSAAERLDLLFAGSKMFFNNFLAGVGFGNFQVHSAEYMDFFPRSVYAHNTYLTIAAESGIFGIFIYGCFLWGVGRGVLRTKNYYLFVSFVGLVTSNFFVVAHFFPITYIYFAAVIGLSSFYNQNAKRINC